MSQPDPPPPSTSNSSPEPTKKEETSDAGASKSLITQATERIRSEVDPKHCVNISIFACFLTGFTSAPSFSVSFHPPLVPKNRLQMGEIEEADDLGLLRLVRISNLGLAVSRCFAPGDYRTYGFEKPDQQAFCSLLSFLVGTSFGRIGDKLGAKTRTWLCTATFLQALMAMAAALAAHYSGETGVALERGAPSWQTAVGFVALGFLSASMGLQGIIGKRIASPMNTTVVLTTTWVELFNDPFLFALRAAPSRDVRIGGVSAVFFGAFFSRAILQSPAGQAGAIGVLAGLRLIQVAWFALLPPLPPKPKPAAV